MTSYRRRLEAGEHTHQGDNTFPMGNIDTKTVDESAPSAAASTETVQVEAPDPEETTLAELKAEAEGMGLPTYGTKQQIADRIANALDIKGS